jgi:plastocyanin
MLKKKIFPALFSAMILPGILFAAGTISGKVTYVGTPMKAKVIDMSKEPTCAQQHASQPVKTETVVTGLDNTLANVVVYISQGAPAEGPAPSQAVTYDQKGCQYIPHVLAMQVNQPLKIVNNDKTSHNIHPMPKQNAEWNKSQPAGAPPIDAKFEKEEFIPVKCNIHPWMHGYFVVLKTSHYAVSKDDGTFSIADLPPGKYTLTAWHEKYGTRTTDVTITGNETATVNIEFKATAY